MRMRFVSDKLKILEFEIKEVFDVRVEVHFREFMGCAAELQLRLLNVVQVEVGVAEGMHEIAGFQIGRAHV